MSWCDKVTSPRNIKAGFKFHLGLLLGFHTASASVTPQPLRRADARRRPPHGIARYKDVGPASVACAEPAPSHFRPVPGHLTRPGDDYGSSKGPAPAVLSLSPEPLRGRPAGCLSPASSCARPTAFESAQPELPGEPARKALAGDFTNGALGGKKSNKYSTS